MEVLLERLLDARLEVSTRKLEDGTYQVRLVEPDGSTTMGEGPDLLMALILAADHPSGTADAPHWEV